MKILMVIPSYLPATGGAEKQLSILVKELKELNNQISIVTRKLVEYNKYNDDEFIFRLDYKPYPLKFLFNLLIFFFKNRKKFDLIHVHTLDSPFILSAIIGKILKKPVIVKITRSGPKSQIESYKSNIVKKLFLKFIDTFTTGYISISHDIFKSLKFFNIPSKKIFMITNGVKIINKKKNFSNNELRICYVGRLIERKRVNFIIEALAILKKRNPNINFNLSIIGDGPKNDSLRELVKLKRLKKYVKFIGNLDNESVQKELEKFDCLILPSLSEGQSNALLEGMASNLAIIASNIPSHIESINHYHSGLLFNNIKDLADYIEIIYFDRSLLKRLGHNARKYVSKNCDIKKIAKKTDILYRSLIN